MTATLAYAHQPQAQRPSAQQSGIQQSGTQQGGTQQSGTQQSGIQQGGTQQSGARGVSTPRLRLTRRGRVVLTSLVAGPLVALALVTALNGGVAAATSDLSSGAFDYVTVHAGQSLWELAESVAPASDPREVISDIVRLNQLENSELQPGDRIAIPAAYSN